LPSNAGQNIYLLTASKSFENLAKFSYLGTKVKHRNCFHDEIKSKLNSGSAC